MLSVGQIIRIAEGIITVLAGVRLDVGQAGFRRERRGEWIRVALLVSLCLILEIENTFYEKYSAPLYTFHYIYLQLVLFLFYKIDFWELFAKNVLYWINLQVVHYFVLTLDCLRTNEFFLQYVDERYENPYTLFHIVFMLFTICAVLWLWYKKREHGFICCPNPRGYLYLSALATGEAVIAKLSFTKEQAIRVVTREFVIFLALLLFVFLCLFIVFLVMRYNWEIQYQDQLLRMNYRMMRNQYRLVEEMYNEKRRYLHDIKHQHLLLEDYLVKGKEEEALSYLKEMNQSMEQTSGNRYSGFSVIDFMLDYKIQLAKKEGIAFFLDIQVLFCPLKQDEMCILLGNLLDNAIEAVRGLDRKKREIRVRMMTPNNMFLLEIQNPYEGMRKKVQERYLTTKSDQNLHGLGLDSVKRIVEKNGGFLEISDENQIFQVNVTLMGKVPGIDSQNTKE